MLFGGKPLSGHAIPSVYGAIQPTAVFVPLKEALKPENFDVVTTEVFGPFQVCNVLPVSILTCPLCASSSIGVCAAAACTDATDPHTASAHMHMHTTHSYCRYCHYCRW